MTLIDHLLTCLAEEGGEVAKECCKALRFGLDDKLTIDPNGPRGTEGPTNREKIALEMIDMIAVYDLLVNEGIAPDIGIRIGPNHGATFLAIRKKQEKVRSYLGYAVRVGALPASRDHQH
jgi:hypothetical protein